MQECWLTLVTTKNTGKFFFCAALFSFLLSFSPWEQDCYTPIFSAFKAVFTSGCLFSDPSVSIYQIHIFESMIKLEVQEEPDEDYICNYLSFHGIMKLKTVVCDASFSKMLFFITDFYSSVSIPSASTETSFKISCSAQSSVSIFGKKFYFVFHSEVPGTVGYVQNPENTP